MFAYCVSLPSIDLSHFDTHQVDNVQGMFFNCASLTSLDLSGFDLSSVTDAREMVRTCKKLMQLNMGNNDLHALTIIMKRNSFYNIGDNLGTTLTVGEGFDLAELGTPDANGVYTWLGGKFKLGGAVGIKSITSPDADAPRYDLMGRRVGKDYKGIVIQNGRKFFNR